jgi:hypothetical protein
MLRLTLLPALFALLVSANSGPSSTQMVPLGPDKLAECTSCEPIWKTMVKCQTISGPAGLGKELKECICVPNPDGWYGYMHQCRACLSDSNSNDFFDNLASMIGQLLTSCTNAGGNVYSKDGSICATNAMWAMCAALKDGRKDPSRVSWASFERSTNQGDNKNATFVLNIEEPEATGGASGSSSSSDGPVAPKTGEPTSSGPTGSRSTSATPTSTSGANLGYGSQMEHVVSLVMIAAGVGVGLL